MSSSGSERASERVGHSSRWVGAQGNLRDPDEAVRFQNPECFRIVRPLRLLRER